MKSPGPCRQAGGIHTLSIAQCHTAHFPLAQNLPPALCLISLAPSFSEMCLHKTTLPASKAESQLSPPSAHFLPAQLCFPGWAFPHSSIPCSGKCQCCNQTHCWWSGLVPKAIVILQKNFWQVPKKSCPTVGLPHGYQLWCRFVWKGNHGGPFSSAFWLSWQTLCDVSV